ncbi:hypothetical protein PNOK_0412100 [Pyrrhoderma noxium]|uniref:Uncharacterized protein n=1 Tax=Pyrrhoderma noxium TaxID=2282107 RepID=A0A286UPQ3_9AGAM|nr:hypothetical protein PNOK_0412100 [Pyrrhoderma noxium]
MFIIGQFLFKYKEKDTSLYYLAVWKFRFHDYDHVSDSISVIAAFRVGSYGGSEVLFMNSMKPEITGPNQQKGL